MLCVVCVQPEATYKFLGCYVHVHWDFHSSLELRELKEPQEPMFALE